MKKTKTQPQEPVLSDFIIDKIIASIESDGAIDKHTPWHLLPFYRHLAPGMKRRMQSRFSSPYYLKQNIRHKLVREIHKIFDIDRKALNQLETQELINILNVDGELNR